MAASVPAYPSVQGGSRFDATKPKTDLNIQKVAIPPFHDFTFHSPFCDLKAGRMGILATVAEPFSVVEWTPLTVAAAFALFLTVTVVLNVLKQLLWKNPTEPPMVFHLFPLIGSTITYGMDPVKFFHKNKAKYGDCFTFILLGKKTTVFVGKRGNDFILNGKHSHISAEEVYNGLTKPVFGKDVVYDCPNSKLMEQKKFVKFGLTTEAFQSYVPLIQHEVEDYVKRAPAFKGSRGSVEVVRALSETIIFTASRTLQGKEVRSLMNSDFADWMHDLDMGFSPINFMLPWFPLPHNRRRDAAHKKMIQTYADIAKKRRAGKEEKDEEDMIWNLLNCTYKDGSKLPDHEIGGIMIALLMGGQHSSASTTAFALLHLAERPDIQEKLIAEQKRVLGEELRPLKYEDLAKLTLHAQVIKETLRMHSPIHSILRRVKQPIPVEGTPYIIPTSHQLLAAPIASSMSTEYFPNPEKWQPERWDASAMTVEDEEKVDYGYGLISKGANSPYLPFGAGRHRCIGEQFAYLQMQTIIATLVKEFKFSLDPKKPFPKTDYSSLFSRPLPPAMLIWERRNKA
ncbi:uncharacterized protein PV09_06865 [Verruconis gallopava]|uniref:Uncharacterized protein n=1 Tax=Verruconis gallopava TaxID=253628 RepID=A0A0D2AR52_9PEZI|nr:uncharacterized protein PV09_06865 [Verruconis gallopava]KIW01684.1 hypothetical protein PV09_06865 [Verruconis gallopava]